MMWPSISLLAFVTVQRLAELGLAHHNTQVLLSSGAKEAAPQHYPYMVALHSCWIAGLWLLAIDRPIEPLWFAVFLALQAGRLWVIGTLKGRWTTRIIVLPGAPLVSSGPYRFLAHPNYVVVAGEIAVLPLAFGMPAYAAVFSLLNAVMLYVRIKAENKALGRQCF
ncbi:isoprenylcysteine carboxyl methyltransferase family protein [Rhizobium mesoamericanum]|uniref:Isoprenylcysteine carboxyl methyltransferase n=1 Tax=Rhizobium mesoamericanum STM3625 TaxID=1211777 RepID=K0PT23_9HYPH|nr:isoprenylcysteine carboxylmethyltransferase family protein [Rhizobium mesoamericanum]CCM74515.1 Isoprenylcysteine carboxyl methyltransferase [Rhizobium mesoamericanum STM3625]